MRHSKFVLYFIGLLALLVLLPAYGARADSQTLTVTPPLFQISVNPGQLWQSSVKVVNSNPYDLTVYAEVVNFEAQGERGQGRFVPIMHDTDTKSTLAEWIDVGPGPYTISREQTANIPFFIEVPDNAPPGGHFAAVLISTKPPKAEEGTVALGTSQAVTSLFFLRIEGDVVEHGNIREFRSLKRFYDMPTAEFSLRFENKGNVHLQPKGNIIITNMWGKERGVIPVNYQSHFGNVLPHTIRDFRFTWSGEPAFTEIGRYTAEATLAYGEAGSQSVTSYTTFWVIPVRATLITIGSLIFFIVVITFMIRLYVRRMLTLAGVDVTAKRQVETDVVHEYTSKDIRITSYKTMTAPLTLGAKDLRSRLSGVTEFLSVFRIIGGFILSYRHFFLSLIVLILSFVGFVYYVSDATIDHRNFEVTIDEPSARQTLDAEEVIKTQRSGPQPIQEREQPYEVRVINGSGVVGLGAQIAEFIEEQGIIVAQIDTATTTAPLSSVSAPEQLSSERDTLRAIIAQGLGSEFNPEVLTTTDDVDRNIITVVLGLDSVNQ